ncbi:unnamed protein product [Microthlaspi erraticum]|uniref:Aspartic peptidase DDI1-type domain-containing protein n=1 Tax=Microthlaspi erraticum TaxID=1685480 RepID=A0A6D2KIY6_9BRAS|nr:unnamed protein product [Microthlaspi erraticum]
MNHKLVEINSKLESLTSRVQIIESSSASSSSPQEYAQAVTLRSGRQFPSRSSPPQIAVDIDDEEGEDLSSMLTSHQLDRAGTKPEPELDRAEETETQQDKPELDRAEKRTDKASSSQPTKPVAKKKDTPSGPPPYKPPLPFPGRFKKQLLEAHRPKIPEGCCSAKNQGSTRDGSVDSLCDLGSSVSLMPLSVAKRLGYHKYQACGISLVLADRSIRLPTGMLEDLPLRIGNASLRSHGSELDQELDRVGLEQTNSIELGTECKEQAQGDWSELKAPKVDLKPLPEGLRYAFLGENSTYPVIVNSDLEPEQLSALLVELRKYRKAIGYTLDDIKGSPLTYASIGFI